MPLRAQVFRWSVGAIGGIALLALLPFLNLQVPVELAVLAALSLAAELVLTIKLGHQRALSFGAAFAFTIFLAFGAATATVIQVGAWLGSYLIQRLRNHARQPRLIFLVFNAGQLALCSLIGGLVVWLLVSTPLDQPPPHPLPAIMMYSLTYLAVNIGLTSIATWLRFDWWAVRNELWPNVSLWTTISFAASVPLALFMIALRSSIGFVADVVLTWSLLAVLSYIVRINLRFRSANHELEALNEISHTLASRLHLTDIFPAVYVGIRKLMVADLFMIGLINNEAGEIDVPFLIENNELLAPRSFALDGTLTEQAIRSGQPQLITNVDIHAHQTRFGRADKHPATVMFVPLCVADRTIGIMSVQSYTPQVYTPHQLKLLAAIGRIASVAINNARLFEREKDVLRSRDEFISLVAHELKNPLAALLGHTQILERRVRLADEKLRRPVSTIQEQGERLNRLVEDLLDLSRADSGRLTLHHQRIDMSSLTRHVAEQHGALTDRHQIVVKHAPETPLIEGDALRLTQVMQNLLSNAIKYSPDGGTITIRLMSRNANDPHWPRRVRKLIASQTCWLLVQIEDQGMGIPEDQLSHIFERFYRAHNVGHTEIAGTGLGLSVCEGLIRAHGGAIWAESQWGNGSTFSFVLPVPPRP